MKKYRLGYSYLFLADRFKYSGEDIGALTINVAFKVYGKNGKELLYSNTDDSFVYMSDSNRKVYACDLFRCSVLNKDNLFELIPQTELLKLLGNVSYEIVGYTKELVSSPYFLSPEYISKEEFEDIFRNNFERFDTTNNKSAQVPSYFTQEVLYSVAMSRAV